MKTLHIAMLLNVFLVASSSANAYQKYYSWGLIKSNLDDNSCLQATKDINHKTVLKFLPCVDDLRAQHWFYSATGQIHQRDAKGDPGDCIDIPTESNGRNGTKLQLYRCNDNKSMRWKWKKSGLDSKIVLMNLSSQWQQANGFCLAQGAGSYAVIKPCDDEEVVALQISSTKNMLVGFDAFPHAAMSYYRFKPESWMHDFYKNDSEKLLVHTVIPGTHNSGTYHDFKTISTTQQHSVVEQLNNGIRYLDLRIDARNDGMVLTHGRENGPAQSMETTFKEITLFADEHPREIIIVDIHEVPDIDDNDPQPGLRNIRKLAYSIDDQLGNYLIKRIGKRMHKLTYKSIWDAQDSSGEKRNIILLIAKHEDFRNTELDVASYMWNRRANLHEEWPESTDFSVIVTKNHQSLKQRDDYQLHSTQFIRTPSQAYAVSTTLGFTDGPYQLTTEKTGDGYFNHLIGGWMNIFTREENLLSNIFITDFYHLSSLVPMALWLNYAKANIQAAPVQQSSVHGDGA